MGFLSEKPIKATRKRHLCSACDKFIEVGEAAINWAGVTDGDFGSLHYHPECRAAELAYNRDCLDRHWSDDWQALCDAESEDRPWIKENWPLPYMRMCMTREQWAAHPHKPPHSADGRGPTRSTPGVVGPFNHEGQSK